MSVEKLEEEIDKMQDEMEALEENCDSLDICKEDDGCSKCDAFKKMEAINLKIEELENKIEELTAAEETES
jgi:prefoldin subunit 5